ncbi:unnamed protein product [Clonostachys rhizophaga]|uniref:Uncharacterized protein n=1 Tax=Clonostachys rhizophaga TaxID=160324 RepID=A0A9N9YJZ1_9HYPO|nr:unnamed protein product [Clonostachys rhizophaga]
MSSARGTIDEVPETPQPNAIERREDDASYSSPESTHEADSDYRSGTTPVKSSRPNKKRQHSASNEQSAGSSAKQPARQSKKQQDAQAKRGQRSGVGSGDGQSPPKRIKINTGKSIDRIAEEINGGVNKLAEAIKDQRKEIEDQRKEIEALKNPASNHLVAQLNEEIQHLKSKNQELQIQKDGLQDLIQRIGVDHELLSIRLDKQRDKYRKVCDDEISRQWSRLAFIIQSTSLHLLDTTVPKVASADEPYFMALIRENPRKGHVFLQRFIWKRLYRAIFQGTGGIWCGHMSSALNAWRVAITEQCIKDPANGQTYAWIKSETAHELFDILEVDVEAKTRLADEIASQLMPLAAEGKEDYYRSEVLGFVDKAIELQTIFMRSKALFIVSFKDPAGLTEEEAYHYFGPVAPGDKLYTVTPVLAKIGDADGHNDSYDGRTVVCGSRVIAL